MKTGALVRAAAGWLSFGLLFSDAAFAQKAGGILKISHFDSPASMSLLEELTAAALRPVMGIFNNLVVYDQHVAQNSMRSIVPELATSWSLNEEGTELTFPLRQGVKWHDGKPFTAQDVKCTWDLLSGKASEKLRINPRKSWYNNVEEVTTKGEHEVTFRLKRPQPALLALLASGWSPIYPCHVSPRDMRSRPIGTGPFKFVEFKPNEVIRVTQESRLLERGTALSRRHRVGNHQRRVDAKPGLYCRQGRSLLTSRHNNPDREGHQEPGAASNLRGSADKRQPDLDHQPR